MYPPRLKLIKTNPRGGGVGGGCHQIMQFIIVSYYVTHVFSYYFHLREV